LEGWSGRAQVCLSAGSRVGRSGRETYGRAGALEFLASFQKPFVRPPGLWQFLRLSNWTLNMAYAIIRSGGKQYRVIPGQTIAVDKLAAAAGEKVTFGDVVLFADGATVTAGDPMIAGAKVVGEVVEQFKDKKVIAFKFRRRKGYHRTVGHRRQLTRVKIEAIDQ
jgi:large subunit ribosomal protein L21